MSKLIVTDKAKKELYGPTLYLLDAATSKSKKNLFFEEYPYGGATDAALELSDIIGEDVGTPYFIPTAIERGYLTVERRSTLKLFNHKLGAPDEVITEPAMAGYADVEKAAHVQEAMKGESDE